MIELKKSVEKLKPYFVNEKPYKIKLDANETKSYLLPEIESFKGLSAHLYPDSDATSLREKLAKYYGCQKNQIMVGNGSSDMINLVINGFCEPRDKVLGFKPSFSMYDTYCQLAGADYCQVDSNDDYSVDLNALLDEANNLKPKVVIICNPNNPTGYYIEKKEIIEFLENFDQGIVILDEAYIDFGGESLMAEIEKYKNLIVMRTLSKAFGLASLRIGCLATNSELLKKLWAIKMPYNVNAISQLLAEKALDRAEKVHGFVKEISKQRDRLSAELTRMGCVVYPSKANFIMIKNKNKDFFEKMCEKGILIRKLSGDLDGFYRISVGNAEEIDFLIRVMEALS